MKKKRVVKRFRYSDLIITANDLLAVLRQEAIIHPDPSVRTKSRDATTAMEQLFATLRMRTDWKKNEVLNMISDHPVTNQSAEDLKPMFRTLILANRLATRTATLPIAQAIRLLQEEKDAIDPSDEFNQRKHAWTVRQLQRLKEARIEVVKMDQLLDLSQEAVLMEWHRGSDISS